MNAAPGDLDQVVRLERVSSATDEYGSLTDTWAELAAVWAHVAAGSGGERDHANQRDATARYTVTIRNRRDLTTKDRLIWLGEVHEILHAPDPGPRSMYRQLEVERGAP